MRPILYPDKILVMPPRLCASVGHYAQAWLYGNYVQDWEKRFDKREKDAHRFTIADTRGTLQLTVPVAKPESSSCRWSDIRVSTHGAWWDVHRVALESAYGRTPYFEFYIDRFLPMLTVGVVDRYPSLSSLALAWDNEIRRILTLSPAPSGDSNADMQEQACVASSHIIPEYYQVRADKLGFIPGLSILDLIFNIGPEAPLYLHAIASPV